MHSVLVNVGRRKLGGLSNIFFLPRGQQLEIDLTVDIQSFAWFYKRFLGVDHYLLLVKFDFRSRNSLT